MIDPDELDRHITGNWGEDSVPRFEESLDEWLEGQEDDAQPAWKIALSEFYRWARNYDYNCSPFSLFLDLIGWSADNVGGNIFDTGSNWSDSLGYLELDLLGDALKTYADRPQDVKYWLDELSERELSE